MVQYFEDDCNQRLVEDLEGRAEELAALRTPQRVRLALRARLEMLIPFIGEPYASCRAPSCDDSPSPEQRNT